MTLAGQIYFICTLLKAMRETRFEEIGTNIAMVGRENITVCMVSEISLIGFSHDARQRFWPWQHSIPNESTILSLFIEVGSVLTNIALCSTV